MPLSSAPPAAHRTRETARPPPSAARLKVHATKQRLSVVERHDAAPYTCASLECAHTRAAEFFARTTLGPLAVAVSLCPACAALVPAGMHVVPIRKGA